MPSKDLGARYRQSIVSIAPYSLHSQLGPLAALHNSGYLHAFVLASLCPIDNGQDAHHRVHLKLILPDGIVAGDFMCKA